MDTQENENELSMETIDEIREIASQIRYENEIYKNLYVYVNSHNQIVLELQIDNTETMFSFMNIMEEFKNIQQKHLENFESTLEIYMNKGFPVIYITYERI